MTSVILNCDFTKQFSDTFRRVLDEAAVSNRIINIFHVIKLPIEVEERALIVFSTELLVLKSLREQAEREFAILNRRLNQSGVTVTFEVGFSAAHSQKTLLTPVL